MSHIIAATEEFVRSALAQNDASHDFAHIERVRYLALRIAGKTEGVNAVVVELAALLHDVKDYKYTNDDVLSPSAFLSSVDCDRDTASQVLFVVDNLGFKKTAFLSPDERVQYLASLTLELKCVQDADYLDAIGAIGIARCFTFGGRNLRPIYDNSWAKGAVNKDSNLSEKEYADKKRGSTVSHFYEKLLTLKDRMLTEEGKREADRRHAFMELFLKELGDDCFRVEL
ncbi:hypothetical protein HDU83_001716 [Entophlyctis luteolus]|nr:hypothetical protein HDU82_008734 [Entophlyctis luteolus]KAJ3347890.1 hypothetical protein HDU83_001716 [Entophlyctis luteolus]KAJ3384010.1 hypothetical protein HDU84_003247 [Entophlyctis sp. JEL0112]